MIVKAKIWAMAPIPIAAISPSRGLLMSRTIARIRAHRSGSSIFPTMPAARIAKSRILP
jgi:hypothetical protein